MEIFEDNLSGVNIKSQCQIIFISYFFSENLEINVEVEVLVLIIFSTVIKIKKKHHDL